MLVFVTLILIICSALVTLMIPLGLKKIVQSSSVNHAPESDISVIVLGFGAVALLVHGFWELRNAAFARVSSAIGVKAFAKLFEKMISAHDGNRTAALSGWERLDQGITALATFTSQVFFQSGASAVEAIVAVVVLTILFGPVVSMSVALFFAVYILVVVVASVKLGQHRSRYLDARAEAASFGHDMIQKHETVLLTRGEKQAAEKFKKLITESRVSIISYSNISNAFGLLQGAILAGCLTSALYLVSDGVAAGINTFGDIILIYSYLMMVLLPMQYLGQNYQAARSSLVAIGKMRNYLENGSPLKEGSLEHLPQRDSFDLKFQNVSFRLEGQDILLGLDLDVPEGKTTAVTGPSGSGKSTIWRLLYRILEPTKGIISLGGINVSELKLEALRSQITVIPQEAIVFNETILFNLGVSEDSDEVRSVLEAVCLSERMSSMPDGLYTRLGKGGIALSGGEAQRLSIARALLKKSPVVVLDEATANLDASTERRVWKHLKHFLRGRTVILISHNLDLVSEAEHIVVIEKGSLVEKGCHDSLIGNGSVYADLWKGRLKKKSETAHVSSNSATVA